MKLLKLFLLLSIGLWADIAPSGIKIKQLSPIIENGWNDHNKTLNKIIVDNGERKLPEILIKLDEPLSGVASAVSVPKILLTRDDYYFIFSYVKYLEAKGEINQAIEVYIRALKGLAKIKNDSFISYIYRLVIEMITVESIEQMVKTKKVSATQLANMREELQSTLLLDRGKLFNVIKKEVEISNIFLKQTISDIKDKKEQKMIDEIRQRYIGLLKNYYDQYIALEDDREKEFIDTFEKQKKYFFNNNETEIVKYHLLTYNSLGKKYLSSWKDGDKNIEKKDVLVKKTIKEMGLTMDDLNIDIAAKTMFYTSITPPKYLASMKHDIDEEIKRNKALLKSLER